MPSRRRGRQSGERGAHSTEFDENGMWQGPNLVVSDCANCESCLAKAALERDQRDLDELRSQVMQIMRELQQGRAADKRGERVDAARMLRLNDQFPPLMLRITDLEASVAQQEAQMQAFWDAVNIRFSASGYGPDVMAAMQYGAAAAAAKQAESSSFRAFKGALWQLWKLLCVVLWLLLFLPKLLVVLVIVACGRVGAGVSHAYQSVLDAIQARQQGPAAAQCVICMNAPRSIGFQHADGSIHYAVCRACSRAQPWVGQPCPVCRQDVTSLPRIIVA